MRSFLKPGFILGVLLLSISGAFAEERPRVLFLGDPGYHQIGAAAAKELGERAKFVFPSIEANDSGSALNRIDEILGEGEWKVIFFNFGHGDLFYKDPRTKEIRAMSKRVGGVRVSTAEQYKENLEKIVNRLKESGAKIIWGSTTPMVTVNAFPSYQGNLFDANSEIEYNRIAAKVMASHGIAVCDAHAYVMAQFAPEDKHPAYNAYQKDLAKKKVELHAPVAKAIAGGLKMTLTLDCDDRDENHN
jgi:lysophospholipase L1-like esterase